MPNWFYFTVNVSGKEKDVKQFVENVKGSTKYGTEGSDFDFNHFIPQPENVYRGDLSMEDKKRLDKEGVPNWYDWNTHNWGTKWNAAIDDVEIGTINGSSHFAEYRLRTAWADPRPVLIKMLDMYPDLNFTIEGEEESNAYGIYISTSENLYLEEEPQYFDDECGRAVYWSEHTDNVWSWKYVDNDEEVPNQDDFYPESKFSWT